MGRTLIHSGGNSQWQVRSYQRNLGDVELRIILEGSEASRLAGLFPGFPVDSRELLLLWRSTEPDLNQAYFFTAYHPDGRPVTHNRWLDNTQFRGLFKAFYSPAETSFQGESPKGVTALSIDTEVRVSRAGGGAEITQLLVDIRAADAEDLAQWVGDNPGAAPARETLEPRFERFRRAFEYMFPTKRFRGVRRHEQKLIIEFEEFGRTTPIDNLSTGEKQIVFRAGFLLRDLAATDNAIVLIDEPELSLHPEWQARILGFYETLLTKSDGTRPQILIATHSPFIVHGAANAKAVILQKNFADGTVSEMEAPVYPGIQRSQAVAAFNIDSFLAAATKPMLVLTEGESDASILYTAWEKLYPGRTRPFEARAALGVKNLNTTLADDQLSTKLNGRIVVGLFDFDTAYDQWKGLWKRTSSTLQDAGLGLLKRHANGASWAMLLPVPSFRNDYASVDLGGRSILSIEFLFDPSCIPTHMLGATGLALGQETPFFRDAYKNEFAELVRGFPSEKFAAFRLIFDAWEKILENRFG